MTNELVGSSPGDKMGVSGGPLKEEDAPARGEPMTVTLSHTCDSTWSSP